jgi:1-deoxy-D-xylulose-5-phosphate reductoisomerase
MKKIAVLGATGSIGKSTLDVIRKNSAYFEPALFSAHSDKDGLFVLGKEFPNAKLVFSGGNCEGADYSGREGLLRAIEECGADIVVNGIAGGAGLEPSLAALDAGIDIALANKETIVMAGETAFEKARAKNARIIPVDSEHSAVFQLLRAHSEENLDAVILTASGGPFRTFSLEKLAEVKPADALAHPTWKMGAKITVDSATMANKGLEVIEAVKLFGVSSDRVKVVVHPQSIVHSMIRFTDGGLYAQLSEPDMRRPIQDALFFPQKGKIPFDNLDFSSLNLTFENPDEQKFPLLPLAYYTIRLGGLYPAAYNAANEEAVSLFLAEKIGFLDIARAVEAVLQKDWSGAQTLDAIFDADKRARKLTYSICLK